MKKIQTLILSVYICLQLPLFSYAEDIHILKKGETLYAIAKKYGISVEELIVYNGVEDPRELKIGSRIKIPSKETKSYKVKPGDTFYGIAKAHGIPLKQLLELNGFSETDVLQVGETLLVPTAEGNRPEIALSEKEREEKAEGEGTAKDGQKQVETQTAPPKNIPLPFWPHDGKISFIDGKLRGIHFTGSLGDPITAVEDGEVVWAGPYRGYGKVLIIQSKSGYTYVYGGNGETFVQVGDRVERGMKIASLGILPKEGTPTLFFSVFKNGRSLDLSKATKG